LDAKASLQLPNLQADGAGRDVQFLGGPLDADMAGGRLEGAQAGKRGQWLVHDLVFLANIRQKARLHERIFTHTYIDLQGTYRRNAK
jgi:hypothetical protein